MKRYLILFLILLIPLSSSLSQDVEPWEYSFDNNGVTSTVYGSKVNFTSPDSYIMLYGWPDYTMEDYDYRDFLTGLAINLGIDAIIVCPDPKGTNDNQRINLGKTAYNDALANYNIDPEKIIMNGDLDAGLYAFTVSLANPDLFTGVIGISPKMNIGDFGQYAWDNLLKIRMAVILGSLDYFPDTENVVTEFKNRGAALHYMVLKQTDYNSYIYSDEMKDYYQECLDFILSVGSGPEISADPSEYDFGKVELFNPQTTTIKVKNTGGADLEFDAISVVDDNNAAFKLSESSYMATTLQPEEEKLIGVIFTAEEEDTDYSARIKIESNAANEPVFYINLKGKTDKIEKPEISFGCDKIDFGDVLLTGDDTRELEITNTGDCDLTIFDIEFHINTDDVFSFSENYSTPMKLEAGEVAKLGIKFSPKSEKEYIAIVRISSNAYENGIANISVIGEGIVSGISNGKAYSYDNILSLALAPNPIQNDAILTYTLNGDISRMVDLSIVDINGRKLTDLVNKVHEPGIYQFQIRTQELTSGTYFISGVANGYKVLLPVIISR